MKRIKIEIEHPLNSTSRNIVWQLISTAEGLQRWIADRVDIDGSTVVFAWGDDWRHHEARSAQFVARDRYGRVRWRWNDESNLDTYVEIRMERSALSGEYALHITDFASPDDEEWQRSAWAHNFDRLYRSSGV